MGTLIYDPDMEIGIVDQSIPSKEAETPSLDTSLAALFAGFTSKGKRNVILEHRTSASLMSTYGSDFGSFSKYGQTNLTALGVTKSKGRSFFCSLLPEDAKRAYVLIGVKVTNKLLPVYERSDTVYSPDRTAVLSFGKGAFVLDENGEKIQCIVKTDSASENPDKLVEVNGAELTLSTRPIPQDKFNDKGEPSNYTGEPITETETIDGGGSIQTVFYPLFVSYYYSNGKGGNSHGFRIVRDTGRDKKMTDGRRYYIEFYEMFPTGGYGKLYPEPHYFSFNPTAMFSSESTIQENLKSVYLNIDSKKDELPIQLIVYEENYDILIKALSQFKENGDTDLDIDFINCVFKNGNPYNKIRLSNDSIDPSTTIITLSNGTDGSIDVGQTVDGVLITEEIASAKKKEMLIKFFKCDIDDNIFDEKITDIDILPDCNYDMDVKKVILSEFSKWRPDIKLVMDVGITYDWKSAINTCKELIPYVNTEFDFMSSFGSSSGAMDDNSVGSPYPITYTYDYIRGMADNFSSSNGAFQMHAGANRGKVRYMRPYWFARKNKSNMFEEFESIRLNWIQVLNKSKEMVYGLESTQYSVDGSKLCSDRNSLVIGRAMRICHGVFPYFKYDERDIEQTLAAAEAACLNALMASNIPSTIKIEVKAYQTKQDKRTENAHCDLFFTFPNYAKRFKVTIFARRPSEEE